MRRVISLLIVLCFLLAGCSHGSEGVERGIALRDKLLSCKACKFSTELTADFGEKQYCFTLECSAKSDGEVSFSVIAPDSIAGISGKIDDRSGTLSFDDTVLAFPLIADGEIAPITAPWLFWKALLGGYIRAAGEDGEFIRITIDDSFNGENIQVDVWTDKDNVPVSAEIGWQGRVLLFLKITEFQIL